MKEVFFKSPSLPCDPRLWQEESCSRCIYNARFYEKLARKPKGEANFVLSQPVLTDAGEHVSIPRSRLKKRSALNRAAVIPG